jgi:HAD superfamily hydrolase (TIGR01509 family)
VIGLGFALRGTLTAPSPIERRAFIELVRERRQAVGEPPYEADVEQAADRLFPDAGGVISPAHVADAALQLAGDRMSGPALIARFRQIGDRIASDMVSVTAETRDTLERIDSLGIPTAVLCNGWSRIAQREIACAGFTGKVLVSEDIGFEKPAAEAFEALVNAIGLPAECIWYVGDDPQRDIHGAAAAGMKAVWLNQAGVPYPAGLEQPALTIRSLEELLPPLCEEYTRALLSLRHIMRTTLDWREGHYVPTRECW